MKKLFLLLMAILLLSACGADETIGLPEYGVYSAKEAQYGELNLVLDFNTNSFCFANGHDMTYADAGKFERKGNKIFATFDYFQEKDFVLEIIDEKTVRFIESESMPFAFKVTASSGITIGKNTDFVLSEQ